MIQAIELGDRLRFYLNWLNQKPIKLNCPGSGRDSQRSDMWEISEPTRALHWVATAGPSLRVDWIIPMLVWQLSCSCFSA